MSSDGSRPARMEWADSMSVPTRAGSAVRYARPSQWPGVGRYAWSIGSFGFISPRMRTCLSCSSRALTASTMRPTDALGSFASRM